MGPTGATGDPGPTGAMGPSAVPGIRSGTAAITATNLVSVTFSTPLADANYSVAFSQDGPSSGSLEVALFASNKTANGFDIDNTANRYSATVDWVACEYQ